MNRPLSRLFAFLLLVCMAERPARAWDPATTQAGLTQRAIAASTFHKVLSRKLGRPLGALEPLALHSRLLPAAERRHLWARLMSLDPEGGYRPDADGVATASGWVTAGAVLAETPPERGRNHFFDPSNGQGLDNARGLSGTLHAFRLALDAGGSLRGLATGTNFDLTGKPSLDWVKSPQNDQGFPVFAEQLGLSVSASEPQNREAALVRALLALGGILAALEDAGEPAHVRNDFRGAFLRARQEVTGPDQIPSFERFVAERYARVGVPAASEVVRRPNLDSYFSGKDGAGLADRTQRRFFSTGTLPEDVPVDAATTPREVLEEARASLSYPQPTLPRLELRKPGPHYVMLEGRRALAYERFPGRVRFFLDERVYADTAHALLPEVGAYAAGMIDHLLRASLAFAFRDGRVTVSLEGPGEGKTAGSLELLAEDAAGARTPLAIPASSGSGSYATGQLFEVALPAGTRRVAAVLRGTDSAGPLVAVGEAKVQ